MAVCRYCKKHNDPYEWPENYRTFYSPSVCFSCYCEDPSRGIEEIAHLLPEHEKVNLSEEPEPQEEDTINQEVDPQDDVFPDVDSGCLTEDDDYETDYEY